MALILNATGQIQTVEPSTSVSATGTSTAIDLGMQLDEMFIEATVSSFSGAGTSIQPQLIGAVDAAMTTGIVVLYDFGAKTTNLAVNTVGPIPIDFAPIRYMAARWNVVLASATGTLTSDTVNVADAATFVVGTQTYRFKNTPALAFDVQIGGTAAISTQNAVLAVNATGVAGTNYFAGTTANTSATAVLTSATIITLTAITSGTGGNSVTLTGATHLVASGATLTGGTNHSSTILVRCQSKEAWYNPVNPNALSVGL